MSRWEKLRRPLFIVIGGVMGLLAFAAGVFDALTARPLESHLFGVALAVVGAGLFVGAACELYRPWRRTLAVDVAFWSGIASLAITVYLLSLGLPLTTELVWVWIVVICAFAASGILSLFTFRAWWPEMSQPTVPNPTSRTPWWILSGIGITASLLFSIFQFWYAGASTSSKVQGWGVNLVAQLKDDGPQRRDSRLHNFTIHVFLKNSSGEQLRLVNSLYVVSGITLNPALPDDQAFAKRLETGITVARYTDHAKRDLLEYGRVVAPNSFVQSTEELTNDIHLELPNGVLDAYNALALWVQVELIRSDDVIVAPNTQPDILSAAEDCRANGRSNLWCKATKWKLERPSLLWWVIRGDQVLVSNLFVDYHDRHPQSAWLDFCVDAWPGAKTSEAACVPKASTSYFERLYKLSWVSNEFDLPTKPESTTPTPAG